jgi:hypothetical protein
VTKKGTKKGREGKAERTGTPMLSKQVQALRPAARGGVLEHALSPNHAEVGLITIKLRGRSLLMAVIETESTLFFRRDLHPRDPSALKAKSHSVQ